MSALQTRIRSQFPSLESGAIFFDNPGGTQVPRQVVARVSDYYLRTNANHGGLYRTSQDSDAMLEEARGAAADFLGASPREVVFGNNMTTLAFHLSHALASRVGPGDEILVTRLDHDGNISPWLMLAQDRGATLRWVDVHPEDCTLVMEDYDRLLTPRTRIVAVGYASNAVGTVNDVATVIRKAHAVGALVFVDAVQYAPHAPIDVKALDADFLACSSYKFFGPHAGLLYGKADHLEALRPYKVRPADDTIPCRWETGTQNHEGIAGMLGTFEYLEWLGQEAGWTKGATSRRERLVGTMEGLHGLEADLCLQLIQGLQTVPGLRIHGITDPMKLDQRVPTVGFTLEGHHPDEIAKHLAAQEIYTWSGHYYAISIMERLGLLDRGGMLRVGLAHYNTPQEIDRLVEVLRGMV
jgi:cysteine desulfurase family protein (TIGR01976 family)